jgi:ADP-dependent NAD(P)H-hydrate dehydratase / NAD(P)H-hydrate epimerase
MRLVTAQQMRAIDRRAIEEIGIPGFELMEKAGRGIADFIKDILNGETKGRRVAIFCGRGNNGGDGYVIARYLHSWGATVQVFLLAEHSQIEGDALVNLQKIEQVGLRITKIGVRDALPILSGVDLVVDGIFGTGFHGQVEPGIAKVIDYLNSSGVPILAIDTPSGLDNDTGGVTGTCIKATYTATLALPKIGQYFYPGRGQCGQIKIIDIGIPAEAVAGEEIPVNLTTAGKVKQLIPDRKPTSHKGDCGKLLIIAGSVGLTGAATLAAEAAVKSGSGLVTVGVPKSLNDILEVKLTEAMTKPLPENRNYRCLAVRAHGVILESIATADAVCLGPGIGRNHETMELFRRIIAKLAKPAILDADGLFAFSSKPELLRDCPADLVLTPHVGEFARLCGKPIGEIQADRLGCATAFAKEIGKVVLLKGVPTLVASPEGKVFINPTGNAGMATGGSGDVLTGVIGSLLALGIGGLEAAICGAYLHGLAGDLAQKSVGTFGLVAGDIVNALPKAFRIIKD